MADANLAMMVILVTNAERAVIVLKQICLYAVLVVHLDQPLLLTKNKQNVLTSLVKMEPSIELTFLMNQRLVPKILNNLEKAEQQNNLKQQLAFQLVHLLPKM